MEVHSVLPEERARNEKGETLPWGYRYADTTKNPRQPEESGPFGRNRSIRYTSSSVGAGRRASTRQGTTPSRQKENSAVNDFTRLFAKEQAALAEQTSLSAASEPADTVTLEKTPTECLLYGYANKSSEWKVISRFEKIVSPGIICEDYDREDPSLYQNSGSPMAFNRGNITVHRNLSKEALAKSRVYKGGSHWIKVTFDSWEAAERACFYSPVEIDGFLVHCELWSGRGPLSDAPVPRGVSGELLSTRKTKAKSLGLAAGAKAGVNSAMVGFEQAMGAGGTLPRSLMVPDVQYGQPAKDDMDVELESSATASSATATATALSLQPGQGAGALRSRSVPNLPSQSANPDPTSQFMSRAPGVRRAVLRPVSEALPPQQSLAERILRSLPVVNWLLGFTAPKTEQKKEAGLIGEGPVLKDDGTWDGDKNGWYWKLWHGIDGVFGTDFCGLKED